MELTAALVYFNVTPTADLAADLTAAGREAAKRRSEGPQATKAILRAMRDRLGWGPREIERITTLPDGTKISRDTASRLLASEH